jgi:hypothetical protein
MPFGGFQGSILDPDRECFHGAGGNLKNFHSPLLTAARRRLRLATFPEKRFFAAAEIDKTAMWREASIRTKTQPAN